MYESKRTKKINIFEKNYKKKSENGSDFGRIRNLQYSTGTM